MRVKPSRNIYIFGFVSLGFFVSFLAHAGIEIAYINFLEKDLTRYSLGMTWRQLLMLHHSLAIILAVAGLYIGYRQGVYWWNRVYNRRM